MKLILLAACANALVVPPRGLARRNLPVAKGFYDEDDEHDEEPRPWADAELGGVRLPIVQGDIDNRARLLLIGRPGQPAVRGDTLRRPRVLVLPPRELCG